MPVMSSDGPGGAGEPRLASRWDASYQYGSPPWDIGRPQREWIRLADEGQFKSPVLDSGCGTGENTLLLAERGLQVLGVDVTHVALDLARAKAAERGVAAEFAAGNVLELGRLGRSFASVLDSGVFHVFSNADKARYVASLASVVEPGGVVHLMCFSEHTGGSRGPKRVSQAELRAAFAKGWRVESIQDARFEVREDFVAGPVHAWLAKIVRTP